MRFFDYNATTPLLAEAREAWLEASESHWMNPSSPYRAGAAVHAVMEEAREKLAYFFDVAPERVIFNAGATEGNNAVFATWAQSFGKDARIAVGETEHPSVIESGKRHFGQQVDWVKPDCNGAVQPDTVDLESVSAVSVMAANNETGALNPWERWSSLCGKEGVPFHCDASQWIGKMPLGGLGACDFVTACAHKFGGPKGVGFTLAPEGFFSGLAGGSQESRRRAGTENVAGILSMVAALETIQSKLPSCSPEKKISFLGTLQNVLPGIKIVGEPGDALWNTVSIVLPEFKSARWIRALERRGFLVSAGSACSTGRRGPSHVLAAMGMSSNAASRVIRISSGWETSTADWSDLLEALLASYSELKAEGTDSRTQVISI